MANICGQCGESVHRQIFNGKEWLGEDCGCLQKRRAVSSVEAPALETAFSDLTLDHVFNERGEKLRVTSSRQLAQAEQRYQFISVVRNQDAQNFNDAPQQKRFRVEDVYKRKFERRGW
jgi:exonuclease VII small subunit